MKHVESNNYLVWNACVQLALSKIIFEELKNDEKFAEFQKGFKDSSLFYFFNYTEIENQSMFWKIKCWNWIIEEKHVNCTLRTSVWYFFSKISLM